MWLLLHTFRRYLKSFSFYALGILILIGSGLVEGNGYINNPSAIDKLMNQFPKSILAVLGMYGFDLTTLKGYYGLLFLYLVIIGFIYAGNIGVHLFADEETDKTSEFLYTKPISRARVFIAKYSVGIIYLILFNLVIMSSSEIIITQSMQQNSILPMIFVCCISLFITQWMFFSLSVLVACGFKHNKKAFSIISIIVMVSYLLYIIKDFSANLQWFKWITPVSYLDVVNIAVVQEYAYPTLAVAVILAVFFSLIGLIAFRKRDFYL